jgi:hypothetical protein
MRCHAARIWAIASSALLGACALGAPVQLDEAVSIYASPAQDPRAIAFTTIPFVLDTQRVVLEVSFEKPGGGTRKALAWFNMGMAKPVLAKPLYRELRIDGGEPLRVRIGETAVQVAPGAVVDGSGGIGVPDFAHLFAPCAVEAMLPASVLQFVVTLDYAHRSMTLAKAGGQPIDGLAVPCTINPKTGFVTVDATVDGRAYPVVIDAGSGYSWLRGDVVGQWLTLHPEWRRAEGAVGQSNANMVDYAFEKTGVVARVPEVSLGSVRLKNAGVLGTGAILGPFLDGMIGDLFWDNWQKGASGPVVGWLGGNVLKNFKLAIDYPNRMTYWRQQAALDPHDLDQVGLTLVRRHDRYFIGGIVRAANPGAVDDHVVSGVEVGDELVAVDGFSVTGAAKDAVLSALHGKPGERRALVVEHGGVRHNVDTVVSAFD